MSQVPKNMSPEEQETRNQVFQKISQMNMQFESLEAQIKQGLHQNLMKRKDECYNKSKKSADDFANCSHSLIEQVQITSAEMKFRIKFFENRMEQCLQRNTNANEMLKCTEKCEQLYHQIFAHIKNLE